MAKCVCSHRHLLDALESELSASKSVNQLQVLESNKLSLYLSLLQDEIGDRYHRLHSQLFATYILS